MTAHAPVGTVDGVGDTRTARFERVLRRPPEGVGRTDDDRVARPVELGRRVRSGWHSYLDRLAACLAGERPPDWAERLAEVRPLYDGA
jgi:hypothetical protein